MSGTTLQRFEAMYPLHASLAASQAPTYAPPAACASAGPYALRSPQTSLRHAAQVRLARGWVWTHVGASLIAAIIGVTLFIATPTSHLGGEACLGLAMVGIACSALALHAVTAGHLPSTARWLLAYDFIATGMGMLLLGPELGLFFLLPGAVLVAALLTDHLMGIIGLIVAFALYAASVALTQTGFLSPLAEPSSSALVWGNLGFIFVGTMLFAYAAHWLLTQLRAALLNEAALTYRLQTLERRTRTKRISTDADAMALQTQIALAMANHKPRAVTTNEELAPLAQMINAANARIPSLLHDRDERLKLERAIRDLVQALETACAGFAFTLPAPSHTIVDRLIPLMRPIPLSRPYQ